MCDDCGFRRCCWEEVEDDFQSQGLDWVEVSSIIVTVLLWVWIEMVIGPLRRMMVVIGTHILHCSY